MKSSVDEIMRAFIDYDKSMEPKKINKDAKITAFNKKKEWFIDALAQHLSYIGNDKHKIKINGEFAPVGKSEDKAIKGFSELKNLIVNGEAVRCLVLKLRFKGSPSHIVITNSNISTLPLPKGVSDDEIKKTRIAVIEKIRDDIVSGKYDEQIKKFGSKQKKSEDEAKPVV